MAKWPTDKELEEIYRKGSEFHDFEFRPDAWDDMEKLLDNDKKRLGGWLSISLVLGLLALSFFSYNYFSQNNTSNQIEAKVITNTATATNSISSTTTIGNKNNSVPSSEIENFDNQKAILNSNPSTEETNSIAKNANSIDNLDANQSTGSRKTSESLNLNYTNNNRVLALSPEVINNTSTIQNNLEVAANNGTSTNNKSNSILEKTDKHFQSQHTLLSTLPFSNDHSNKPSSLTGKAYHLYLIPSVEKSIKDQGESFKRFFFGVTTGVETSWTPNGEFSQLDYSLGLKSSYFVSPRWGINVGATYQRDQFVAEKGDYRASESFWKSRGVSSAPEFTQARGNMLELSLGTSYSFNNRNENGFSVSADIGNTFMLSEWYDYNFADESENFSSNWSMENHSFLSAINLSSNYRIHLSNNFLFEAGPYLRIPLSGVGHGNTRLSSLGLRVTVGLSK